jgi:hypothetical protein
LSLSASATVASATVAVEQVLDQSFVAEAAKALGPYVKK